MDNKEIQIRIDELKENIRQFEDELHKSIEEENKEENKKKWWKPQDGDLYCYINANGETDYIPWEGNNWDINKFNIGNCFQIDTDAELYIFERQLEFKLKKFAYENNEEEIDWSSREQSKYSIYYDYENKELDWEQNTIGREFNQIFFTSKEIAEKAIETFRDDLIRYFTSIQ